MKKARTEARQSNAAPSASRLRESSHARGKDATLIAQPYRVPETTRSYPTQSRAIPRHLHHTDRSATQRRGTRPAARCSGPAGRWRPIPPGADGGAGVHVLEPDHRRRAQAHQGRAARRRRLRRPPRAAAAQLGTHQLALKREPNGAPTALALSSVPVPSPPCSPKVTTTPDACACCAACRSLLS